MTPAELGKALQAIREAAGLSQVELARRLDLTAGALSLAERGQRVPRLENLDAWARATGRTLTIDFPANPDTEPPDARPIRDALPFLAPDDLARVRDLVERLGR